MKRIYSKPEMMVVQMRNHAKLMIDSEMQSVETNLDETIEYKGGRAHDSR